MIDAEKFWTEGCKFTKKKHPSGKWYMYFTPDGKYYGDELPSLSDLNALRDYAIPQITSKDGYTIRIIINTGIYRVFIDSNYAGLKGYSAWSHTLEEALVSAISKALGVDNE